MSGSADISITDGVLVLRRQRPDDLDMHLSAIDDSQIDWLWAPGDRALWEAKTAQEQREHQARHLQQMHDSFGPGPKWAFSVDAPGVPYAVFIKCDLANPHVPTGEANISYACHPAYRGRGWTTRAVRLACVFLRDYTPAARAHLIVDAENAASVAVARAAGFREVERFVNEQDRPMIRHVIDLTGGLAEQEPVRRSRPSPARRPSSPPQGSSS